MPWPPISSLVASAMAPRSAAMLMVLAMNSSATTTIEQPCRIMPADIAGNAVAGDAADARGDFLDRRHQRKRQQHGPADAVAELRAGLAVGADPRRIVVGRAGDQAGAERFQRIAEAKRPWRARPSLPACRVPRMRVRVMLRIRFVAICHAGPAAATTNLTGAGSRPDLPGHSADKLPSCRHADAAAR